MHIWYNSVYGSLKLRIPNISKLESKVSESMQVLLFKLKYVVHMREDLGYVYLRHVHKTDWAK